MAKVVSEAEPFDPIQFHQTCPKFMTTPETKIELKIPISKEGFLLWRRVLATVRETKGLEEPATSLSRALLDAAEVLGLHEDVVNLHWEEFLSGQHLVMNELIKPVNERDKDAMQKSVELMDKSSKEAHQYILDHEGCSLDDLGTRSYRFLGRVADYKGDYHSAIENYRKATPLFEAHDDPMIRIGGMEVSGFLACSLIMSGQVEEGLSLANKTYGDFFKSEDAKLLRKSDYYTWVVWASGIPIRTIDAMIDSRTLTDKIWAKDWLDEVDSLLVIPEGDKTWGDKNFEYRKDELGRVREKLRVFKAQ